MGLLGQVLGVLLLLAGAGLTAWGAPYYMLDWGSTFVMAGIALTSAGLSCLLLGTVLNKLKSLRSEILALRGTIAVMGQNAATTPAEEDWDRPAVTHDIAREMIAGERPVEAAPPQREPIGSSGRSIVPNVEFPAAIGVAAAAGGLAVAANSIFSSVKPDTVPEPDETASQDPASSLTTGTQNVTEEMPNGSQAGPQTGLTDSDRASLDDLLATLSLPVPDSGAEPEAQQQLEEAVVEMPTAPIGVQLRDETDDFVARINSATDVLKSEAKLASEPSAPDDVSMDQRIEDEFADLRAELAAIPAVKSIAQPSEPELDARVTAEVGASDPVDHEQADLNVVEPLGAGGEADNDQDGPETPDEQDEDASRDMSQPKAELSGHERQQPVETDSLVADDTSLSERPSSNEGVVAAYNVGDTSYAMFVDGRIKVSAPEGEFVLNSMEELKSFMAAKRAGG